jgi:hypothetical protein
MEETQKLADMSFFEQVNWDIIAFNKISKEEYLKIRGRHKRVYATLLGSTDQLQFYMFKPLSWGEYKDIKSKSLDKDTTHEYILNACVLWPKMDALTISSMEAGIMLTLVYQILATSYFLKDPNKALEMIIEV